MNNNLMVMLVFLTISCDNDNSKTQQDIAFNDSNTIVMATKIETSNNSAVHENPYKAVYWIQPLQNNEYELIVDIKLFDGAYFVSPNAKRDFSGKFTIQIEDSKELEIVSDLLETPQSVEEFDEHPFVNGLVNWVRVDTRYKQKMKPTTTQEFSVKGFIQFTIEPRCTLENIPIIIKNKDEKIWVELFGC
jgi:hypothetical protein